MALVVVVVAVLRGLQAPAWQLFGRRFTLTPEWLASLV